MVLPEDPAILLLDIYSKDAPSCYMNMFSTMIKATLFVVARNEEQPKCLSTEEQIKKWFIYTVEYYSAIKNKDIMTFAGKCHKIICVAIFKN